MGVGAQHRPLGLHALWGLRATGVVGGRPRGGWPATVVRGVCCQALPLPRPPVLWGGQPGFRDPCVPGAVGAGVGTQHRPHSVRPCGPALLAVGVAEGRPRGECLPPLRGASEVGRSPSPDCPPTGRAVGVRHPRAAGAGVWVWGPITVPLACMPCAGCVPRGWWGAVLFGVNGSLREAFDGVGWSFGTNFGGRGGDGGADPVNIFTSCKASVAAARAAASPVDGTGKGYGPTTSSPSVS